MTAFFSVVTAFWLSRAALVARRQLPRLRACALRLLVITTSNQRLCALSSYNCDQMITAKSNHCLVLNQQIIQLGNIILAYSNRIEHCNIFVLIIETKVFLFQFEITINVLVSSFCFSWILMLWVYVRWNFFNSFSAGAVFMSNLTSTDNKFWRIKG